MNENLSLTHEELLICERLRSLRMSGMADAFESQMLDPNAFPEDVRNGRCI